MAEKTESFSEVEAKEDKTLQNVECDEVNSINEDAASSSSKQIENTEATNDSDVPLNIKSGCVIKSLGGPEGEEIKEEAQSDGPEGEEIKEEAQSDPVDDSQNNSNSLDEKKCTEDNTVLSDSQRKQSDSESENRRQSTDEAPEEEKDKELDVSDQGASGCVDDNENDEMALAECPETESKTESVKEKRRKNRPGIQRPYGGSGDNPSKKDKKNKIKNQHDELLENEEELRSSKKQFHFFWQNKSVLSQWYLSKFYVDDFEYNCAEQYMMHQKALLMGDEESAGLVMALTEPREQKNVGRSVQNFDQKKWDDNCMEIVKKGNIAKFSQNDHLKKSLFSTYPKTLVEASPLDKIWGIGLAENDKRAWNKKTWRGENRLGQVLTEVRDELMRDAKILDT